MDMQEQMNFIHEVFSASLPRLGAGDDASTKKALAMLAAIQTEIDLYRQYSDYYGNVFYLMRRV